MVWFRTFHRTAWVPSLLMTWMASNSSSSSSRPARNETAQTTQTQPRSFSPEEWRPFEIVNIFPISHNTRLFRMKLDSKEHVMGISVASCILLQGEADGELVARPYTPTTHNETMGWFDLIIKKYPQGAVSSFMFKKDIGDHIRVKGPFPKIEYHANLARKIGMIAGGTGITPMLQVTAPAAASLATAVPRL